MIENPVDKTEELTAILSGLETYYDAKWLYHFRKSIGLFKDSQSNLFKELNIEKMIFILYELESHFQSSWIKNLRHAIKSLPPHISLADAMSIQQIRSKKWAMEQILACLGNNLGLVFNLGGWYGTLPAMMFDTGKFKDLRIRSFDIDPICAPIADTMNRTQVKDGWKFKASTADMLELDYENTIYTTLRADGSTCEMHEKPDTLINLCCEHLEDFPRWIQKIPKGLPLVLQSNNFFAAPDHRNCVHSLEEFKAQAGLAKILFAGELVLQDYTRFMLIGSR